MPKKMLIDATQAEETRVVVVDGKKVQDFDFESQAKRQIAGNIYLAKITRVEPSLQAAFVDYGGNRHGFLAFGEIHPDYYQIPVADREALLAEEMADAEEAAAEAEAAGPDDSVSESADPAGMEVLDASGDVDGDDDDEGDDADEGDAAEASAPSEVTDGPEDDRAAGREARREARPPRRKARPRRYKIQEVVKVRQIMLVQVVKEERGNKGAALTTYLSLAGRYCVLMPNTARGGGISRKITNAADRKKLKEIATEIEVPKGAGLIVRTAGAKRTKSEIKRDYEYLQRLWEQIRELTLKSIAPAQIYEEGDIIKRSIRDLYNREIDEVIVDGDEGYRTAKDFMKMIMPSHAKNVKPHAEPLPLFAKHQVEGTLAAMFNPTVQLPSGGYIVIGVTEALVAVDVNSGRSTREGSIEETALKTNLEAAEEVARQAKLRDLAGLIVIDFIDMDERRDNAAVEKRLKDALKTDRARVQTGRISAFGLLEMSRQRLRPGMIELTTQPCPHCHGTGLVRSDSSLALSILRQIEEEGVRRKAREVLVKAPVAVVNWLFNHKRDEIAQIEARYGLAVLLEGDPAMRSPDFSVERFKSQTRRVEATAPVITAGVMLEDEGNAWDDEPEEDEEVEAEEAPAAEADDDDGGGNKKRRRRSRGGRGRKKKTEEAGSEEAPEGAEDGADAAEGAETERTGEGDEEKPKRRRRTRGGRGRKRKEGGEDVVASEEDAPSDDPAVPEVEATREVAATAEPEPAEVEAPAETPAAADEPAQEAIEASLEEAAPEPQIEPEPAPEPEPAAEATPKRRGWWSRVRG